MAGIAERLDIAGVRHLGVTRAEYEEGGKGSLKYTAHVLASVAAEGVNIVLGFDSHVSQPNIDRAAELQRGEEA